MTHGERTLSGIAEELERLGDIHALFQGDGPTTTALREAATLIRTAEDPCINAVFETRDGPIMGSTDAPVKRIDRQDDGSLTVVIDHWPARTADDREKVLRDWVAKLYCSSGCDCCRDYESWEAASNALGELLSIPKYEDGSGFDFYAVRDAARQALGGTNAK